METDLTPGDRSEAVGEPPKDRSDGASEAKGDPDAPLANESGASNPGQKPRGDVHIFTSDNHLRPLAEIEADIIRFAIGHNRGQMSEVARRLGIGRSTLYRKLSELDISPPNC